MAYERLLLVSHLHFGHCNHPQVYHPILSYEPSESGLSADLVQGRNILCTLTAQDAYQAGQMPSSHWREVLSRKAIQEGFFKQLERKKMPKASVTSFWRDMVSKYSNLSRLSPLARLPCADRQAASSSTYRGTIAIAGKASALLASSATAEDTQRASGSRTVTSTSAVVQCPTDRRHKSPETAQLGKRKRSVSPRPQRSARSDPETNLKTSRRVTKTDRQASSSYAVGGSARSKANCRYDPDFHKSDAC